MIYEEETETIHYINGYPRIKGDKMDLAKFWRVIETVINELEDSEHCHFGYGLYGWLITLSEEEVLIFTHILRELRNKARTQDIWEAANIIIDGCSDQKFTDFLNWIISWGENAYKEILKNPDNLVYITYERKVTDEYIVTYTDVIDVVAEQVYREMTGEEIPNEKKKKSSKKFKQNPRFPKLWAKFKEDPEA